MSDWPVWAGATMMAGRCRRLDSAPSAQTCACEPPAERREGGLEGVRQGAG